MASFEMKPELDQYEKPSKKAIICQSVLRVAGIFASLIATVLMIKSKEKTIYLGFNIDAKFSYSPPFVYFVYANATACFLSFLALANFSYCVRLANCKRHFLIFFGDLVALVLSASSLGAGTAIGLLGKYGNTHTGWLEICDKFSHFCDEVQHSLAAGYLAAILFFILTLWSSGNSKKAATVSSQQP
ncbi:hypothetical protein GIB67_041848 [Kingdonia uniflora]|uniref:CASP-like protein n=1 Tax=Kingdonia uniflora TaxID=39325 RepID=A0A7J7L5Q1_9MAGN|nr:hypothetical protein GIB67_041848 [Kingdonia uniflora]